MLDSIVLLTIILFVILGWRKGLCQYMLEFLIMAISLIVGWLYYQQNQGPLKAVVLASYIFIALSLIKWFIFKLRPQDAGMIQERTKFFYINKFLGAALGFTWATFIISLTCVVIDLVPAQVAAKYNIKRLLVESRTGQIYKRLIPIESIPLINSIGYINSIVADKDAQIRLSRQPAFKKLLEHQAIQEILKDQETVKQLLNKDFSHLLTNPKILNLLNDQEFIKELMKLDLQQAQEP